MYVAEKWEASAETSAVHQADMKPERQQRRFIDVGWMEIHIFFEGTQEAVIYYHAAWFGMSIHIKVWAQILNSGKTTETQSGSLFPCLPILHPDSAPCASQEVQLCTWIIFTVCQ